MKNETAAPAEQVRKNEWNILCGINHIDSINFNGEFNLLFPEKKKKEVEKLIVNHGKIVDYWNNEVEQLHWFRFLDGKVECV